MTSGLGGMWSSEDSNRAGSSHGDLLRSGVARTTGVPPDDAATSSRTCTAPLPAEDRDAKVRTDVQDLHGQPAFRTTSARSSSAGRKVSRRCAALRWASNSASTRRRALPASRTRRSGSSSRRSMATASAAGSRCGTMSPVTPSFDLGDAGYGGRDAGGAQGHRLQKDGRQSIAVPVGTHDAGHSEHRRVRRDEPARSGDGVEQIDSTFESQTCDLRSQLALLWSGTDDLAGKLSTLVGEMAQPSISTANPFFSTSRPTPRIRGDRSRGDE